MNEHENLEKMLKLIKDIVGDAYERGRNSIEIQLDKEARKEELENLQNLKDDFDRENAKSWFFKCNVTVGRKETILKEAQEKFDSRPDPEKEDERLIDAINENWKNLGQLLKSMKTSKEFSLKMLKMVRKEHDCLNFMGKSKREIEYFDECNEKDSTGLATLFTFNHREKCRVLHNRKRKKMLKIRKTIEEMTEAEFSKKDGNEKSSEGSMHMTAEEAMRISSLDGESRDGMARKNFEETANACLRESACMGRKFANIKIVGIGEKEGSDFLTDLGYRVRKSHRFGSNGSYDVFEVTWDHLES